MEHSNNNLLDLLAFIDPSTLDYQEWCNVGMALKDAGYSSMDWERWSMQDAGRYRVGECEKKWNSFHGSTIPVTAGTIVKMALDRGYSPKKQDQALDWDDTISQEKDELVIVRKEWVEGKDIQEPKSWKPVEELITYLETLFTSTENVGYVTETWEKDGKHMPKAGSYSRTAGDLIQQLYKCKGDIGAVLGDYNPEAGAWIRFNPLDGKGVKNENVVDFRFALVESDSMELDKQNALIRELELPVACLVHSGKKSLHAIVRIDAGSYEEYRKRVDYLYNVCGKNGLKIDTQNRNPSRLSRMPGVVRNGQKQFLLGTNLGKSSWEEWKEWVESINDDLPDPESLADFWDNLPALAPTLIDGILRQGHKMLVAGPSKAGKSYMLIGLCAAIAEGQPWLGFPCAKGKVLYVNLELDRASCLHRFKDVYTALGYPPDHLHNIDIWNLRGKSVPMDKLAPKLIRRAAKRNCIAIVIDPIYKVITGDENSADQMSHFCNQFDKVCTELGCAVIYCHHHSKGGQGSKKSMDRASGSGVFARDPDALLDLIELELTEGLRSAQQDKAVCEVCAQWLQRYHVLEKASQDDLCSQVQMTKICKEELSEQANALLLEDCEKARKKCLERSAWRIEGTLREFPKFAPINLWFDFPVHRADTVGVLQDVDSDTEPVGAGGAWKRNFTRKKSPQERQKEKLRSFQTAFNLCAEDGKVKIKDLAEYMGVSEKTVRRRVKEHENYWIDESEIGEK